MRDSLEQRNTIGGNLIHPRQQHIGEGIPHRLIHGLGKGRGEPGYVDAFSRGNCLTHGSEHRRFGIELRQDVCFQSCPVGGQLNAPTWVDEHGGGKHAGRSRLAPAEQVGILIPQTSGQRPARPIDATKGARQRGMSNKTSRIGWYTGRRGQIFEDAKRGAGELEQLCGMERRKMFFHQRAADRFSHLRTFHPQIVLLLLFELIPRRCHELFLILLHDNGAQAGRNTIHGSTFSSWNQ